MAVLTARCNTHTAAWRPRLQLLRHGVRCERISPSVGRERAPVPVAGLRLWRQFMFCKGVLVISAGVVCLLHLPSTAVAQSFISTWGTFGSADGQFMTPQGVAVGGAGDVYVSDGDNSRVQVFSSNGSYLRQWIVPAVTPGSQHQALNIAVDANENVYVAATSDMMVYRYTSTGALVLVYR